MRAELELASHRFSKLSSCYAAFVTSVVGHSLTNGSRTACSGLVVTHGGFEASMAAFPGVVLGFSREVAFARTVLQTIQIDRAHPQHAPALEGGSSDSHARSIPLLERMRL